MRLRGTVRAVNPGTSRVEDPIAADGAPTRDGTARGGGLPIFDEAPPLAAAFATRPLRPPSRRGPLLALAWAAAFVALVGVGLFAERPLAASATATDGRPAASLPAFGWPIEARAARSTISLESPAHRNVEITSRRLGVKGTMLIDADHVLISLQARGERLLDQVRVDVFDPDGGVRPAQTPTFSATFDLPLPRPNGTMWVVVTAYDENDLPLGSVRRPFIAGPLRPGGFVASNGKGLDGNWPWGPYSEPSPAREPLPTCLPVSPTLASGC
jgi:hypothetical protein